MSDNSIEVHAISVGPTLKITPNLCDKGIGGIWSMHTYALVAYVQFYQL